MFVPVWALFGVLAVIGLMVILGFILEARVYEERDKFNDALLTRLDALNEDLKEVLKSK